MPTEDLQPDLCRKNIICGTGPPIYTIFFRENGKVYKAGHGYHHDEDIKMLWGYIERNYKNNLGGKDYFVGRYVEVVEVIPEDQ